MRTVDLAGVWTLERVKTGKRYPARVPGDTHSALIAAGVIPDPYVGRRELDVQWVGREDWAFERSFTVEDRLLAERLVYLSFDGLDTVAEVSVNGKLVGRSDNMFVRRRYECRRHLRRGRNTVRVLLCSAENEAARRARRLPYPIPHTLNAVQSPHRNLLRKVQCHAGWDWGPCLMVAGIYGGASLEATSGVRIDYLYTEQRHAKASVKVRVTAECTVARAGRWPLAVSLGGRTVTRELDLPEGPAVASAEIEVARPRLWWPAGYGEQPLYELAVDIGGHRVTRRIGLRTIELENREDADGLSMAFRVNGVPVFCKGANWIPSDALPSRQTRAQLEHLLGSAARANMNMLRVWGGGQYEGDAFYDLCDELGILVWHDMMFSCALYPADPGFLAGVEEEVRHQVKRLRDHPSIALWCGNNEDVGALNWFEESLAHRDRYLVDYDRLTEGTIGRVIDECDPTRPFWPSSPCGGRNDYGDNWHQQNRGDMHYWVVWHEGKPFAAYLDVQPRFCSEFGYQSFPSVATIRGYAGGGSLNATAPDVEHHQRHPRGNSIITEMFTRYFRVPDGFESFVYLSQVQQALAIRTAVEYWRTLRPRCMGTLYWQLDDCWPVCSWSSIEHDGTWKLLHYAARRFFAPLMLAVFLKDGAAEAWIVNDTRERVSAAATFEVLGFDGTVLHRERVEAAAPAERAVRLRRWKVEDLTSAPDSCFLLATLVRGRERTSTECFLTEPKRCTLADADVRVEVTAGSDGRPAVRLSTDRPAFYVSLDSGELAGEFDDNCFTLVPGRPRTVGFSPRPVRPSGGASARHLARELVVRHLRASYR